MKRTALLAVTALAALPATAGAQDEGGLRLEYAFDRLDGRVATYTIETEQRVASFVRGRTRLADDERGEADDDVEAGGGEVLTRVRETQEHRYRALAGGRGEVEVTTTRVVARLEYPSQDPDRARDLDVYEYDSAGEEEVPPPLARLAEKVGQSVTLRVEPTGEVTRVRPHDQRRAFADAFVVLPEEPLRLGDSWDRLDRRPMEPLGTLLYHWHYELARVDERTRVLEASIRVDLDDPSSRHRAVGVRLSDQEGSGRLVLDADGLVIESRLSSTVELTVKSRSGNQVQRVVNRSTQALEGVTEGE